MSKLFETLKIRGVEFRNRIVVSPMCQYSSDDGFANDWHLVHLGSRAVGGAALVIAEATAVTPEGRISPSDLGIWKDEHIEFLSRVVAFIHAQGAVAGIQIAHAGRKGSADAPWKGGVPVGPDRGGWQTVAPSAVAFREGDQVPHALSIEEIGGLVKAFEAATIRARKAGFKVVEIHAAHGYLINEFLSPLSNLRQDEYGGSFLNRTRFLREVVDAVRKEWPEENPLFVRISASEWVDDGWSVDDSVELAMSLKKQGVDLIDCSSGGNVYRAPVKIGPMYQTPFAEKVKRESGMRTGAVGLITTARECEQILTEGKADMIFLARQLLRDPYFPLHAAKELGVDLTWPLQYERAK